MRSGIYRHNVKFERRSKAQDSAGQQLDVWTAFAQRKVDIEQTAGNEFFTASGENARISIRMRLRFDPVVAAAHPYDRVNQRGVLYNIVAILLPQRRRGDIELLCEKTG